MQRRSTVFARLFCRPFLRNIRRLVCPEPIDWAGIELTKDNEGRYIIAQPVNGGVLVSGSPVVETQAMAQNNFLTGAFNMAAQIFDRMDIEALLSTEKTKMTL